jgi:hypothetical protein
MVNLKKMKMKIYSVGKIVMEKNLAEKKDYLI